MLSNFELISHTQNKKNVGQFQRKSSPIGFLNGLFSSSSKQVHRKFPIQATINIVLDGALLGLLTIVAIMSSVALHSQYLWTKSFTKLEITRDLNRRILESTSILEGYLLKDQKLSKYLVPTKAEDLIYIDRPIQQKTLSQVEKTFKKKLFERISTLPIKSGY